ncbi:hypothetical protein AAAC51_38330 [Priestia megaterium]
MICEDHNSPVDERSYDLYEATRNSLLRNELDDKNKTILNNIDNGAADVNLEE